MSDRELFCPPSQFTQAQRWNAQASFSAPIREWLFIQIQAVPQGHRQCTSLEYATAWDFPRHPHRKRKVQIQAYSGHKGDCMRPFCIWMHFSLLRDENNTSSAFYSFIHILLHFYLSYKLMRAILKILEILKEKIKRNKKKMRESENLHFKLLPNSSPNNTFFLGGKLQIPNEISHCMNFCIKHFWVAAFPECQSIIQAES